MSYNHLFMWSVTHNTPSQVSDMKPLTNVRNTIVMMFNTLNNLSFLAQHVIVPAETRLRMDRNGNKTMSYDVKMAVYTFIFWSYVSSCHSSPSFFRLFHIKKTIGNIFKTIKSFQYVSNMRRWYVYISYFTSMLFNYQR